jgi:hypothetical protein
VKEYVCGDISSEYTTQSTVKLLITTRGMRAVERETEAESKGHKRSDDRLFKKICSPEMYASGQTNGRYRIELSHIFGNRNLLKKKKTFHV